MTEHEKPEGFGVDPLLPNDTLTWFESPEQQEQVERIRDDAVRLFKEHRDKAMRGFSEYEYTPRGVSEPVQIRYTNRFAVHTERGRKYYTRLIQHIDDSVHGDDIYLVLLPEEDISFIDRVNTSLIKIEVGDDAPKPAVEVDESTAEIPQSEVNWRRNHQSDIDMADKIISKIIGKYEKDLGKAREAAEKRRDHRIMNLGLAAVFGAGFSIIAGTVWLMGNAERGRQAAIAEFNEQDYDLPNATVVCVGETSYVAHSDELERSTELTHDAIPEVGQNRGNEDYWNRINRRSDYGPDVADGDPRWADNPSEPVRLNFDHMHQIVINDTERDPSEYVGADMSEHDCIRAWTDVGEEYERSMEIEVRADRIIVRALTDFDRQIPRAPRVVFEHSDATG